MRPNQASPAPASRETPGPEAASQSPPASPHRSLLGPVPAPVLILTAIISVQVGAGLAARLFSQVAPGAVTGLRLWSAALVLAVVGGRGLGRAVRAVVRRRAWRDAAVVAGFGVTLAVMNYSIYQSFARIPLGVSVTIEFLGPLGVAVASSRRVLDLLWVALAAGGVVLLAGTGQATAVAELAGAGHGGAVAGLVFALVAAAAWAVYILLSRATGRRFPGTSGLTIAMVIAAVAVTPTGVAAGGAVLLRPAVVLTGIAIGLLSSIVPYSLELETLRRLPARVFGIWMSAEPVTAALVGLVMLGQALSPRQWLAVASVSVACAGAARGAPQSAEPQA
ncbi:MAG TPA: EamA family transporter [Streptosporangiaceae bacterium]|nr:EamA family transporter [Streptosporangiaceae bacterium]